VNLYEALSQPANRLVGDSTPTRPQPFPEPGSILTHAVESSDEERAGSLLGVNEP
jgi:hypothetical protein